MSLMPFIILGRAALEGEYSGTKSSKKAVQKARESLSIGGNPSYSFEKHINYMVKNDPKLSDFFKILAQYGQKIDKIDEDRALDEFQSLCHEYEEKEEKVNEIASQLKEMGINTSEDIKTVESYAPVKIEGGKGFGGVGKYSYSTQKTFPICFNGIEITSGMLERKDGNIYQEEYELWQKLNPNIDKREIELEKMLEDKKRKFKTKIFKRKEAEEEIIKIERKLENIRTKISDGKIKKERMDTFNNLTDEQKETINNYIIAVNDCMRMGEDFRKKVAEVIDIGYSGADEKREKWKRAFDRMVEDGAVSQDIIDYVNSILNQEIEDKQDRYDNGEPDYSMNDLEYLAAGGIEWYIKKQEKVHQEKSPLQAKEEKLSSLEKEAKTISEAEAIIDKQTGKDVKDNKGEE